MNGRHSFFGKIVCLFMLMLFAAVLPVQTSAADTVREYTNPFTDVPVNAWYAESVKSAYEMAVIDGVSEDRYSPDGYVTLAECIKLAACMDQVKRDGAVTLENGTDIWYEPYIQYAIERGILKEPYVDYGANASRAQVAQLFSAIMGDSEPILNFRGKLHFRDAADPSAWYYTDVYRLYMYGILVGDDTACFRPLEPVRRSEMAAVAVRVLDTEKRVCHAFAVPDTVETAILMYHHFAEIPADYTVTAMTFRSHLRALTEAGYESITFAELLLYTEGKIPLPEKCVLLVSDDGYSSVLETALPLLEEFDMKMSVAVIGQQIGSREDGQLSHFTLEEAVTADTEGRLELISHSYGLHKTENGLDGAVNVGQSVSSYKTALEEDCNRMRELAETGFPMMEKVFVYPYGKYSADSERYLKEAGYQVTVTVKQDISHISVGEDLYLLKRIPAEWYITGDELLQKIGG